MTKHMKLGIIGGGNMAASLVSGLIADKCDPSTLWVSDPDTLKLDFFKKNFNVNTTLNNNEVIEATDVVLLAVKPQILCSVTTPLAPLVQQHKPLIISIAAGIGEADLQRWLGGNVAIVRCMPNTPACIGSAMTGMFANGFVSDDQRDQAETILRAVGLTLWLTNESLLNAVTALSGAGPAYFFLVMEALERAGEVMGLTPFEAHLLTVQTALGAARLALESHESLSSLRQRVTSKGGVTECAVHVLETGGLSELFVRALQAASLRSEDIARTLGQST